MSRETTTTKYGYFGDTRLTLTSAIYDGIVLDTKVELGDAYICTVAGSQRDEFLSALADVIEEYRI